MDTLWTSIENASNTFWSSLETFLGANESSLWPNGAYSQWDQIVYFVEAVEWTEPWIIILMVFHLLTFVTIILSWGHFNIQAVILVLLALTCAGSEWINRFAADNYRLFTNTQYFDSSGFFIFVILAVPIIFNCFIIIVSWLHMAWKMMVKVAVLKKKASERRSTKQQQRKEAKKTK
ncbi:transmembrane protein 18-like isoform X2 [Dysidea avara]|uniref:transmembrane protein 18-like isoform X2 n=1 Tax=Dysidea avara TaxID=196820 RepID=UPI0033346174